MADGKSAPKVAVCALYDVCSDLRFITNEWFFEPLLLIFVVIVHFLEPFLFLFACTTRPLEGFYSRIFTPPPLEPLVYFYPLSLRFEPFFFVEGFIPLQ